MREMAQRAADGGNLYTALTKKSSQADFWNKENGHKLAHGVY